MRLNKYIAGSTYLSRRKADSAIAAGRVQVNDKPAEQGQDVSESDTVTLDGHVITPAVKTITIMLNKPVGYVVSRDGQGSKTIYDLLPPEYQRLKPVGRLDKNSSGLLLLTNDGNLANDLTHPSKQKIKVYELTLYKPLTAQDKVKIEQGIKLDDGLSKLEIRDSKLETRKGSPSKLQSLNSNLYQITMHEGRNRQIRRTFAALNYEVNTLHRTQFGQFELSDLNPGSCRGIEPSA
jgi:23S rRNA pseudouridine2605 synthase